MVCVWLHADDDAVKVDGRFEAGVALGIVSKVHENPPVDLLGHGELDQLLHGLVKEAWEG